MLGERARHFAMGGEVLRYGAHDVLVSTVELPITGEIIVASPRQPYLCLALELEPSLVVELTAAVEDAERAVRLPRDRAAGRGPGRVPERAMTDSEAAPGMVTAFHRLVHCLGSPLDAQVLAPTLIREITYRLLAARTARSSASSASSIASPTGSPGSSRGSRSTSPGRCARPRSPGSRA